MLRFLLRLAVLLLLINLSANCNALVPPHPEYKNPPSAWQSTRIETSALSPSKGHNPKLPNTILVLRVQFNNLSFRSQAAYPDFLAHDESFFNRWMVHLKDFYLEASHGQYELMYAIYPQVLTMPRSFAYYGADTSEEIDAQLPQMLPDIMQQIDAEVDFSDYGGVIIFHAGAGQESDIDGIRTDQVWSTFLTRKNLQAFFDPENDDYPGFTTNDGAVLNNVVVVPEDEYQDYFPAEGEENASAYLFSIYGVLAHQFGHVLGLPTLFDNNSSNGRSQGIGNWGLMGTGVWNGNGYVPAQPCAWSRCLLGWESPVVISQDSPLNTISHFLDHTPGAVRVYKIPLSATEYFLIENRQQNPDGSVDPYSNQYSYSFKLLPEGEQDYYEDYPLLPYFNFMENSYLGSEWDFFLPGLGGPLPGNSTIPEDGSGLLIWHIDEVVIQENFTANFDNNSPNANALHKGVDLEEADGIQHLDTATPDIYKWGSPYDSFRANNNDYFGYEYHSGVLSLPSAASYYGGVSVEIANISVSGLQMSFSVDFGWRRTAAYQGSNPVNAAAIDFDADGDTELFYPMPDGQLYLWDNEELAADYPLQRMPVTQTYVWDDESLYIPMQQDQLCRLFRLSNNTRNYVFTLSDMTWASHPVDLESRLALPFNPVTENGMARIVLYDKNTAASEELQTMDGQIKGNLIYHADELSLVYQKSNGEYWHKAISLGSRLSTELRLPLPSDSLVVACFKADLESGDELIVQCPNSIYVFSGENLKAGFPFVHNLVMASDSTHVAPLSLADVDGNGSLDIIVGGERGFAVIDYSGNLMSPASLLSEEQDEGISAGAIATDLDGDGKAELLGNFTFNRLSVWENDYRQKSGYPVSFAERSRTLPFMGIGLDGKWYLYTASDNGSLFRQELSDVPQENPALAWNREYVNLLRRSAFYPGDLPNQYSSNSDFVPGKVFIYPNPLKSIYEQKLILQVMPSRDLDLELAIYDISGNLVFQQKAQARAYLNNHDIFNLPADKLSSGVYLAVLRSSNETKRIKFAVEK